MTFRRMSRGFVCSSQWDKERDLNKSIYPRWPSIQPPFVRSAARCCATGWHHAMPRQPKGAQGLSFPIVLGRFWETLQAAFPLAPSPKVAAEPQRREGTLPARQRLRTGAAAWTPPLFSPSWRVTSPPSSLPWVFGPLALRNGPYNFFPFAKQRCTSKCAGLRGSCTPRAAVRGFCNLSFTGNSLLSSRCDGPPCQDRIRPSKLSQKWSARACYPQRYPLQVPGACSMV